MNDDYPVDEPPDVEDRTTSEPIHVFEPKNGPPGWCVSLRVSEEHRPIVCTSAGEGWARQVAADIQKFVDAAVAEAILGAQRAMNAVAEKLAVTEAVAAERERVRDAVWAHCREFHKLRRGRWVTVCERCGVLIAAIEALGAERCKVCGDIGCSREHCGTPGPPDCTGKADEGDDGIPIHICPKCRISFENCPCTGQARDETIGANDA